MNLPLISELRSSVSPAVLLHAPGKAASRLLALAGALAAGAALIAALPKPPGYAAEARLGLVTAALALATIGLPGLLILLQSYRRAARQAAAAVAPRAVQETLTYIETESTLAWRGMIPLVFTGLAAGSFWVLAHWPQYATLVPYQTLLGGVSIATPPALLALLVVRRRHHINLSYLRRCRREQVAHAARQGLGSPAPIRPPCGAAAGSEGFTAGGFAWALDDFFKNALVLGQTGSGKTVCVLNSLLEGMLASTKGARLPIAGLVIDAKGDYRAKLERLCARYGRSADLIVFDPAAWSDHSRTIRSLAWNPLDCTDDELEIASRLVAAMKVLGLKASETFFLDSAKTFLQHAIVLLRAAFPDTPPALHDLHRLATEPVAESGTHYDECCAMVEAQHPHMLQLPGNVLAAIGYFENEFRPMPDRQRGGVIGTLTQLLGEFGIEPIRSIVSGPSTIRIPDAIDQGKLLYIDMPLAARPRQSLIINTLIKLEYQNTILQRVRKERPSFFLCDEFQAFYTSGEGKGDSDFFERSRESRHANIVAAQNTSSFYKKTSNKDDVKNFFGNCAVKIFLRNTEPETKKWAAELFGDVEMLHVVPSEIAAMNGLHRTHTSYSRQARLVKAVPPETFAELAVTVRDDLDRQYAASIVHLASRGETQRLNLAWKVNPL